MTKTALQIWAEITENKLNKNTVFEEVIVLPEEITKEWIAKKAKQATEHLEDNPYYNDFKEQLKKCPDLNINTEILMEIRCQEHLWWLTKWILTESRKGRDIEDIFKDAEEQIQDGY